MSTDAEQRFAAGKAVMERVRQTSSTNGATTPAKSKRICSECERPIPSDRPVNALTCGDDVCHRSRRNKRALVNAANKRKRDAAKQAKNAPSAPRAESGTPAGDPEPPAAVEIPAADHQVEEQLPVEQLVQEMTNVVIERTRRQLGIEPARARP